MAQLVHITSEESGKKILRGGINKRYNGGFVYFMPVMQDFYVSHQWARELKRGGIKCFSAVYFTLPDDEIVWHGKYNVNHSQDKLSVAIGKFKLEIDQMGYEFYVGQRIDQADIKKVIGIPRPMGWRYYPSSHNKKPCFCPACLRFGEYGSSKNRKAWNDNNNEPILTAIEAREILEKSASIDEIYKAMWVFGKKKRHDNPDFLFRVFEMGDEIIMFDGIKILKKFTHVNARLKLIELSKNKDKEVSEFALEALADRK